MADTTTESTPLAIHGGPPVRTKPLPYARHQLTEEDIDSVTKVLRSDWITTGPVVAEFEQALAESVGARHAVAFSSGTGALHGAAYAAGLGPGDRAVTTPLTFAASANAILYRGARPDFVDVERDTLCIDANQALSKPRKGMKVVIAVDYAGHPAEVETLVDALRPRGVPVIEDAAHALGARAAGGPVGSLADLTVFSFHPVKHITTGEGGMVTTQDARLAERLRLFRNHGIRHDAAAKERNGAWFYEMVDLGMNYRLPDFACALGLSQLGHLGENLRRRREIATFYRKSLDGLPGVQLPANRPGIEHAWHLFAIRLDPKVLGVTRRAVFDAMRAENIGVHVHYVPVHLHPYYQKTLGTEKGTLPVSEAAYDQLLTLPLFPSMEPGDPHDVVTALKKVLKGLPRGRHT